MITAYNLEEIKKNAYSWADRIALYGEADLDDGTFLIMNTDYPCLARYYVNEDELFLDDDMIFSKGNGELSEEEIQICEILGKTIDDEWLTNIDKWWRREEE